MALKKSSSSIALFLSLNLVFSLVTASNVECNYEAPQQSPLSPNLAPTPSTASCPMDALKLGVCADLLDGSVHLLVGTPPNSPCCSLISGLVDLEAAVCLCTAIKANVLGINLDVPVSLSLLLNACGKELPSGFQCA